MRVHLEYHFSVLVFTYLLRVSERSERSDFFRI